MAVPSSDHGGDTQGRERLANLQVRWPVMVASRFPGEIARA